MKLAMHHLKARWLLAAMIVAVVLGEHAAWFVTKLFHWRFPVVAVAAACVGLVATVVALTYDGKE